MTTTDLALVSVEGVTKQFGADPLGPVLLEVSLQVRPGEFIALIGPSGCGKSTLLNLLAGLTTPSSGTVALPADLRVGYVFQNPRLLPWRTVARNVEFGLEQLGLPRPQVRSRASAALELVHLSPYAARYPHQLSGGMQQRVALARGLALEPGLFLLDEPFGALDALTRSYLQEELLGLVRRTGTTTLFVTHDVDEALLLADRVVVFSQRPARIKEIMAVPFGPGRTLEGMVADPRYPAARARLRDLLRPEVAGQQGLA